MKRSATLTTASAPNKSRKSEQGKTNANGTHTGGPSAMRTAGASHVYARGECPPGMKLMKHSRVCMPIDAASPDDDETDIECPDEFSGSSHDDSDETEESSDEQPMVTKLRYQTPVCFDIKDVVDITAVEGIPLCSNKNSQENLNGDIKAVRHLMQSTEERRAGRPMKVTYAISGKHFLQPSIGLRNTSNCKVNVGAIQARNTDSPGCGGVMISPGMLARIDGSQRWYLIHSIVAHTSGDSRYVKSDLIIIIM